jgi:hypothetical protein
MEKTWVPTWRADDVAWPESGPQRHLGNVLAREIDATLDWFGREQAFIENQGRTAPS